MADILGQLFGRGEKVQQLPVQTSQQQGLQNQAIGGAGNLLQQLLGSGGGFDYAPLAQQARTQFQTQTIPGLAERFTAFQGGQGGQRSSAFQGALGSAGAGLEQGLASDATRFGLQRQGQQQNLLQMLLGLGGQQSFQNLVRPESFGLLGQLLGQGSQAGANYASSLLPLLLGGASGGGSLGSLGGNTGNYALSGGFGSGYNPEVGFGQQNFSGAFGRGQSF